ncbi:MAG: hypothetical protein JWM98_2284 [Thermoleophilia bacterium]|nr:hypothetical protein [Thermoleophilia bacterium]
MQVTTVTGLVVGAGVAGVVMHRALADDYGLRLRSTDAGQYQHVMIAGGGLVAAGLVSAVTLAVAHAHGWSGVASGAAGVAAGLGIGMVGTVVGTNLLRDPNGDVQREWAS